MNPHNPHPSEAPKQDQPEGPWTHYAIFNRSGNALEWFDKRGEAESALDEMKAAGGDVDLVIFDRADNSNPVKGWHSQPPVLPEQGELDEGALKLRSNVARACGLAQALSELKGNVLANHPAAMQIKSVALEIEELLSATSATRAFPTATCSSTWPRCTTWTSRSHAGLTARR